MYINCYNYTLKKIQKLATLSPCPILACIKDSGLRLLDTHTHLPLLSCCSQQLQPPRLAPAQTSPLLPRPPESQLQYSTGITLKLLKKV